MYKQVLPASGEIVTIYVDGKAVRAVEGASVASAVLGAGVDDTRVSQVKHEPRGPFCLMGVCYSHSGKAPDGFIWLFFTGTLPYATN